MSQSDGMDEGVIEQQNGGSADQVGGGQSKPKTKLIVNYLPINMLQEEVLSLFSSIGKVESCRLICDKVTKRSIRYAFVNYHEPEDAKNAIDTLNGIKLQNETIKISYAAMKGASLFVSNLPQNMALQEFEALFSPYGQIISSHILRDKITGLSKGSGFIRFDHSLERERAIQELNGYTPKGSTKPITVSLAKYSSINNKAIPLSSIYRQQEGIGCPTGRFRYSPITSDLPANLMRPGNAMNQSGWCIFVYNLAPSSTEHVLWELFGPFGTVQRVAVVRNRNNNRCSFGFVTMTNYVEAVAAILSLNGYALNNRVLQVRFKINKSQTKQSH